MNVRLAGSRLQREPCLFGAPARPARSPTTSWHVRALKGPWRARQDLANLARGLEQDHGEQTLLNHVCAIDNGDDADVGCDRDAPMCQCRRQMGEVRHKP